MRTTMSMRQPRRRHGRTNDRRPKIPGKSCCGPGRLLLNSLDSGFWLQLDLARVRPETSFKPVADRTWPKSLCDQNKDASGFSLKRSGPQQDPDTAGGVHPHLQVADGTGPVGRAPDQPPRQIPRAASYHGSNQIHGQRDPGSEKEENIQFENRERAREEGTVANQRSRLSPPLSLSSILKFDISVFLGPGGPSANVLA